MMNLSKAIFLLQVIVFFVIFHNNQTKLLAQTTAIGTDTSALVATVNIENAKIISHIGNKVVIGFDLTNGKGLQTGVKYSILLVSKNGLYIVDQTVYEESLSLSEDSRIHREIIIRPNRQRRT